MECRGSGLKKIISETEKLPGYTEQLKPEFFSSATDFRVVLKNVNYNLVPCTHQDNHQVTIPEQILSFCSLPRSKKEIAEFCGYRDLRNFTLHYINPLLETGQLVMTIPEKPKSRNQRYVTSISQ